MRLWTPEIEALREEARTVVRESLVAVRSTFTDDRPLPTDPWNGSPGSGRSWAAT